MWLSPDICAVGRHERVYCISSEGQNLLVDCGSEATYTENIGMLKGEGACLEGVGALLVTHEHFDHIGAIGRAKAELGCPVICHRLAAKAVEGGDRLLTASEMSFLGVNVPFIPASVDVTVEDGDRIILGSVEVDVYHIPGHTPGGAAYMFRGNLIVGDTVFADGRIGWPDIHWGSCLSDHRDSLRRIADLKPHRVLPGHGSAFDYDESIIKEALAKIDFFESAGIPAKHAIRAPGKSADRPVRMIRLPLENGDMGGLGSPRSGE